MADDHCHLCNAATNDPPEALIYEDDLWSARTVADVPGWVMLHTRRHGDWSWDLSPDESQGLGPLIARLSAATREVTGAERVYILGMGENSMHFHLLLVPRLSDTPPEWRSPPGLITHVGDLANAEESTRVAGAIRDKVG